MANTLMLPGGKEVDLDKVESMDEDEYQGTLYYAKQFDSPQQAEWVAALQEARGEAPTPDDGGQEEDDDSETDFGGMKASEVLDWVGDDKSRAAEAREHFAALDKPPVRLMGKLDSILES